MSSDQIKTSSSDQYELNLTMVVSFWQLVVSKGSGVVFVFVFEILPWLCLAGSWSCPEVVELKNIHIRFHLAWKKLVEEFIYIDSLFCKYWDALFTIIVYLILEKRGSVIVVIEYPIFFPVNLIMFIRDRSQP